MASKTFNIALPEELVKQVDLVAKKEYRNRSELIREALWAYLKDKQEWAEIFKYSRELGRKAGIKSEEDVYKIVDDYRHGR